MDSADPWPYPDPRAVRRRFDRRVRMPLPLVPIAGLAIRYGAVAAAGFILARSIRPGRTSQRAEVDG